MKRRFEGGPGESADGENPIPAQPTKLRVSPAANSLTARHSHSVCSAKRTHSTAETRNDRRKWEMVSAVDPISWQFPLRSLYCLIIRTVSFCSSSRNKVADPQAIKIIWFMLKLLNVRWNQ
nr:uncharacterized protein LOC103422045 [Malus domestica]